MSVLSRAATTLAGLLAAGLPLLCFQEPVPSGGTPVRLLVTAEGKNPPALQPEDVMVYQGRDRARVRELVPFQGAQAGLQFTILIDDGASSELGLQISDLRDFILAQPPSTEIAVGYMRNGSAQLSQRWTADHTLAARALRLPLGTAGIDGSPYIALSDLISKWPEGAARREVLLISNGVDLVSGPPPEDPYLEHSIHASQHAGVVVYSIYFGGSGHSGHSYWRINWGQNYLSQLAEETGGEAYWQGLGNPVSFSPYLKDLSEKLNHQYRLTFLAKPVAKAGLQSIKLHTELKGVELLSAPEVYVPVN